MLLGCCFCREAAAAVMLPARYCYRDAADTLLLP